MSNKLLRTVKRLDTAKKMANTSKVSIFKVTTYGYRQDKTVGKNIIRNVDFQVFEGVFYNYQLPLRENQNAMLLHNS